MNKTFTVIFDHEIPDWLQRAYVDGAVIQLKTSIGWIDLEEDIDFRNSLTYRVKP